MYKKIISIVLVVVCGCKKEEVTSEKTRFLLGFWQVQKISAAYSIKGSLIATYSNEALRSPSYACLQKVQLNFYKDGSFIGDARSANCNSGGQFLSGEYKSNWSFQNEETKLICGICNPSPCDILKLTADSLVFKAPPRNTLLAADSVTVEDTYYLKKTYTIQ